MNVEIKFVPVIFAFALALSLLLQSGSCNTKSEQSKSPSVKQETGATNDNRKPIESSPSNRNAAVESVSGGGNSSSSGKDKPDMKQSDETGSAGNSQSKSMEAGSWGGEHVNLQVNASGAEIEYDCGHGTIEKITVDGDGRFDVRGTHTRERGGPIRLGKKADSSLPARYIGTVAGQSMTLRVTLAETGEEIGAFKLTQGATARLFKCL